MKLTVRKSTLRGAIEIPASKSHTIRAIAIASLADKESKIRGALESEDTDAAVRAYRALGASIVKEDGCWRVLGTGGALRAPAGVIDVGNSGTTLRICLGSCALLSEGTARLTGDEQIQRRPAGPLAQALCDLGADVSSDARNGCAPFTVSGRLRGGETSIEAMTSQYVTSLLMSTPLASGDSIIRVPLLNERPYVYITLDWLERHGIRIEYEDDLSEFRVEGGQCFAPVDRRVPGDFSSATFFLGGGALGENAITCRGLDMTDTQGDKAVVDYLRQLGARVETGEDYVSVESSQLTGCDLDLNATPDALPMMAVVGCFAKGVTRLQNVPQARMKETDRISVIRQELERMGAKVRELPDGLVIEESALQGTTVDGHGDHRVVMSLALAGTMASGDTIIEGAEVAAITYPGFVTALTQLNGAVETLA